MGCSIVDLIKPFFHSASRSCLRLRNTGGADSKYVEVQNNLFTKIKLATDGIDITSDLCQEIDAIARECTLPANVWGFTNAATIKGFLMTLRTETDINNLSNDINSSRLLTSKQSTKISNASSDYLAVAYGNAVSKRHTEELRNAVRIRNFLICKTGNLTTTNNIVLTEEDLNRGIRQMQQTMFDRIIYALALKEGIEPPGGQHFPKNGEPYPALYNETGEYTGVIEKWRDLIDKFYGAETHDYSSLTDMTEVDDYAYGAWLHLLHFDSMLVNTFKGAIKVTGIYGDGVFGKTYSFSDKGSSNATNWNNKDTLSMEEAIPKLTQLIFNTTPQYTWTPNGQVVFEKDKCITFKAVQEVIIRLNWLQWLQTDYIFKDSESDEDFIDVINENTGEFITSIKKNSLSNKTKTLLKNYSLLDLVDNIRSNPQVFCKALFEVLCTPKGYSDSILEGRGFVSGLRDSFNKVIFQPENLNTLMSLYKGIFSESSEDPTSLYNINKEHFNVKNYFFDVCHAFDTTCPIRHLQLFKDENSSQIQDRELIDSQTNKVLAAARRTMRSTNNPAVGLWLEVVGSRKEEVISENSASRVTAVTYSATGKSQDGILQDITITPEYIYTTKTVKGTVRIPFFSVKAEDGTPLRLICNISFSGDSRDVKFGVESGNNYTPLSNLNKIKEYTDFNLNLLKVIQTVTGQNLTSLDIISDAEFQNKEESLLKVCADIIKNALLNLEYVVYLSKPLESRSKEFFDGIMKQLGMEGKRFIDGSIDLLDSDYIGWFIKLSTAVARNLAQFNETQAKDSQGNAQGALTTSTLVGKYKNLLRTQCAKPNAAARDLDFTQRGNDLLYGIFDVLEYTDGYKSGKKVVEFSASEFAYYQFVCLFLKGLRKRLNTGATGEIMGDNIVGFNPSTNSDKVHVHSLAINLNSKIFVPDGKTITLKELIDDLAQDQLGEHDLDIVRTLKHPGYLNQLKKLGNLTNDALGRFYRSLISGAALGTIKNSARNYKNALEAGSIKDITLRHGIIKRVVDCSVQEIYAYNANQMGSYYLNLINAVHNDIKTLLREIGIDAKIVDALPNSVLNNYLEVNTLVINHELSKINELINSDRSYKTDEERSKAKNELFAKGINVPQILRDASDRIYESTGVRILLGDQTYFIEIPEGNNKVLLANPSVVQFMYRYFDLSGIDGAFTYGCLTDLDFHTRANIRCLEDLLDAGFTLKNNSEDDTVKALFNGTIFTKGENQFRLGDENFEIKNWVQNSTGKLILAKIYGDRGSFKEIVKKEDLPADWETIKDTNPSSILLNPLIQLYNALHETFTLLYMVTSVGSLTNHPNKALVKKSKNIFGRGECVVNKTPYKYMVKDGPGHVKLNHNVFTQALLEKETRINDESARFHALDKRNVSMTASKKEFSLGLLDGIPDTYEIAVMEDISDTLYNISGDVEDGVNPYDGAMWVHPVVVYLENNSLDGDRVGATKKLFVHAYIEVAGVGIIIKTCGFAMTNSAMRDMPLMRHWLRKMCGRKFRLELDWMDLTKDYFGKTIVIGDQIVNNASQWSLKPIIYKSDGKYWLVKNIEKVGGPHLYRITRQQLQVETVEGQLAAKNPGGAFIPGTEESEVITINNTYTLYETLGGWNSLSRQGDNLIPSETSIENWTILTNRVGRLKEGVTNPETQDDVEQPLKHTDISYQVTAGAIKQGAANINSRKRYNKDNQEALSTFKFKAREIGVQLDKEHHADNTDVAMTTQVVAACAHLGFSVDRAQALYSAIAEITRLKCADLFDAALNVNDRDLIITATTTAVMKQLVGKGVLENNLITRLGKDMIVKLRQGLKLDLSDVKNLPINDPAIFSLYLSNVVTYLNRGIKIKMPGTLTVLNPSYNLYKTYLGRTWSELENNSRNISAELYLLEIYEKMPNLVLVNAAGQSICDWSQIEIGKSYTVNGSKRTLVSPLEYYQLQNEFEKGYITEIKEDVREGKNLGNYNVKFHVTLGGSTYNYQLYDLADVKGLFLLKKMLGKSKEDIAGVLLAVGINSPAVFTLLSTYNNSPVTESQINNVAVLLRREVYKQLRYLSPDHKSEFSDKGSINLGPGKLIPVKDLTVDEIIPYEVVLPKRAKLQFGLEDWNTVNEIGRLDAEGTPIFFYEKLVNTWNTPASLNHRLFNIELKRANGKHVHIITKETFNKLTDAERNLLSKLDAWIIYDENNNLSRTDPSTGESMYKVASAKDEFFVDRVGNEIIVTEDPAMYCNTINHHSIVLSDGWDYSVQGKLLQKLITDCTKEDDRASLFNYANLSHDKFAGTMSKLLIPSENAKESQNFINKTKKQAKKLYNSWKISLRSVVSRTPSQSMQSFMPMRTVAYEAQNINNIYVSAAQIWLQGSDYDVDAATVTSFEIDPNGFLYHWSPYANFETKENTEASLEIPFPTGNRLNDYVKEGGAISREYIEALEKLVNADELLPAYVNDAKGQGIHVNLTPQQLIYLLLNSTFIKLYGKLNSEDLNKIFPQSPQLANIVSQLYSIIDRHNTWLLHQNTSTQEAAIENFISHSMYSISADPANLVQSQMSVDAVVGDAKEQADSKESKNKKITSATTGNFMTVNMNTKSNAVGKKGVGISAVGLKNEFGVTHYSNIVLNYGDKTEQERLLLGKDPMHLIKFYLDNNTIYTPTVFANVNAGSRDLTEIQDKIREKLSDAAWLDRDAALQISAILGLSVDNAKELKIDKLNANDLFISLYLFGLSVGLSVKDVGSWMMSEQGDLLTKALAVNMLAGEKDFRSARKVLEYIESGLPTRNEAFSDWHYKALIAQWVKIVPSIKTSTGEVSLDSFLHSTRGVFPLNIFSSPENKGKTLLITHVINNMLDVIQNEVNSVLQQLENNKITLLEARAATSAIYNKYKTIFANADGNGNGIFKVIFNKLLVKNNNWITAAINAGDLMNKSWEEFMDDGNFIHYNEQTAAKALEALDLAINAALDVRFKDPFMNQNLNTLIIGAEEFRTLGLIFSLNLGIDTSYTDMTRAVRTIENLLNSDMKTKDGLLQSVPTLFEWAFDIPIQRTNGKTISARKLGIDNLDRGVVVGEGNLKEKGAQRNVINILDVIAHLPHMLRYVQALAIAHENMMRSSDRYRFMYNTSKKILLLRDIYTVKDTDYAVKGINQFYTDRVRDAFLSSDDSTLNSIKNVNNVRVFLNAYWDVTDTNQGYANNATLYLGTSDGNAMFKDYFERVVIPDLKSKIQYKENAFILSLRILTLDKTAMHLLTTAYSLPINMMPKTDEERVVFNTYKNAFTLISNKTYTIGNKELQLKDWFYVYGLIAWGGRSGQLSIMPIFEDAVAEDSTLNPTSIIYLHHLFENKANISAESELEFDQLSDALDPYIIPTDSNINNITGRNVAYIQDKYSGTISKKVRTEGFNWEDVGTVSLDPDISAHYGVLNTKILDNTYEKTIILGGKTYTLISKRNQPADEIIDTSAGISIKLNWFPESLHIPASEENIKITTGRIKIQLRERLKYHLNTINIESKDSTNVRRINLHQKGLNIDYYQQYLTTGDTTTKVVNGYNTNLYKDIIGLVNNELQNCQ